MKEKALFYFHKIHAVIASHEPATNSLLAGGLGKSLYYLTVFKALGNLENAEKAVHYTETALDHLNESENEVPLSYSNGAAGLAYMLNLLQKEALIEADMGTDFFALDTALYKFALLQMEASLNNDFLHGAMGVVHYFLTRLPDKKIENYLKRLLEKFCSLCIETPEGTWFKNYFFKSDPADEINFGLAHGQSGFLILLMQAAEKGIRFAPVQKLVETGVTLLLHYQQPVDFEKEQFSFFPTAVNSNNKKSLALSARLAWCYGDLNIIYVLYRAADFLNKPEWARLADQLGETILLRKDFTATAAGDTHFCHGTIGLAQFYKKLFDTRNRLGYKEAWEYWIGKTLEMLPAELDNNYYRGKENNLLDGLIGVNLGLLSYLSEKELNWGRVLLL